MNFDGPWKIDGKFDADLSVSIVDQQDFEVVEIAPLLARRLTVVQLMPRLIENWCPGEIAKTHLIRSAPELLDALRAIRKIGYDSQETRTREALLKCIDIAEHAISAAEVPARAVRRVRPNQKGKP